jgi:hypothetical protein
MTIREYQEAIARRYLESRFPEVRGPMKAMLVITFIAGHDWGIKEAQDIIDTEMKQFNIEWELYLERSKAV